MNAIDQLNVYLRRVEGRLRLLAISKGAALTTVAALALTLVLVWIINGLAFSNVSVLSARFLLFVAVAAAIGFGLVIPLLRLNRRNAAKTAELKFPDFGQRLLTIAEKSPQQQGGANPADPFVQLLAADTMNVARASEPGKLATAPRIFGFFTSAGAAVFALLWLIFAGPGFLGYGTSLLWAGAPKSGGLPTYDLIVSPGNKTVRRKSDQLITAKLLGFNQRNVRLFAQYQGASKWEPVNMAPQPEGSGFEFLFGGLAENVEYYVEAGSVSSKHYTLKVVDLPGVKKIRVTYHYPKWSNLKDTVEDPGGDLRAVEGTEAEVAIQTDKPLAKGMLMISDDSQVALTNGEGNWLTARVAIKKDGTYHVAAIDAGENVRLSEDFFIEARKDNPPVVKISRPGRDTKVNPIEEVSVTVEGEDDFGLQQLDLKYSVNGGAEKSVSMLKQSGARTANGTHVIYLEDYKMAPGDIVSVYATARDATHTVKTDMYFIEAQPYERNYSQSQQAGGGGGGGGQQADNEISQRQKDIIAATFNEQKNGQKNPKESAEDARFLSELQGKLSGQAKSLSERMKARQMGGAGQEFQKFVEDMDQASQAMLEGADKIKQQKWHEALVPQQKALQHALRAEATFRDIQVAFGQRGGGGGGAGGAGRDLENLFDLELDTEKNQYEIGQQSAADQQQQAVDKALEKLKELARRQQELAARAQKDQQSFQQRWEQEMLRREAEELKKQMEQLQRGESSPQASSQPGQKGQQGQQGQQGQSSSSGQQSGQQSNGQQSSQTNKDQRMLPRRPQPINDPRMKDALDRLAQATEEMKQGQPAGQSAAGQRRAADKLQQAQDILSGMKQQHSSQGLDDMVQQAEQLAAHQQDYQNRLRQTFAGSPQPSLNGMNRQPGQTASQNDKLAAEKEKMAEDVKRIERQMQGAASQTRESQPGVSSKLREALAEVQQNDLAARMKKGAEWIRQGQGAYAWVRESLMTQGVDKLRDQLKEAQAAAQAQGQGATSKDQGKTAAERALARVQDARSRLERMAQGRGQQRGNQGGQQPGQGGQDGQQGGEAGQQPGQQSGQQSGQQGSQQPGQRGQRGNQPGGSNGNVGGPGAVGPYSGGGNEVGSAVRDLSQARQDVRDADPQMGRDAEQLLKDLQRLNLGQGSDAQLDERIQRQLLPALERLELELRRKVDEQKSGQVRSAGSEPVPAGYSESVAEYFRRLSKGK